MNTQTLPPQHPPRSFFEGATPWWHGIERRKDYRRFVAILKKGHTEVLEFPLSLHFIATGLLWAVTAPDAIIEYSQVIGIALIVAGLCGLMGLRTRHTAVRIFAAAGGGFWRGFLASRYFLHDWHDPIWITQLGIALCCSWIIVRVFCHYWSHRRTGAR